MAAVVIFLPPTFLHTTSISAFAASHEYVNLTDYDIDVAARVEIEGYLSHISNAPLGAYERCEGVSNYHTLVDPILCRIWRR